MEEILIGSYIRQKRLDMGWTQEYLCEGICEPPTLSRIENNDRTPSRFVLQALLERLGLPAGQFFALLGQNDLTIENLKKKIRNDRILFRREAVPERGPIREQILRDLKKLEDLSGENNRFVRQFALETRTELGGPEGPYSPEKREQMLMEAIRLTVPRFALDKIGSFRYTGEEILLVNQLSRVYANSGRRKKAISILSQLLRYIEENNQNLDHYPRQFCLAAHNCAIDLGYEKRYDEAIPLAEKGWKMCVEWGEYQFLPGFVAILAECRFFTGDVEKGAELYMQAYSLYKTLGDNRNIATMKREMRERLGLEPPYQLL